MNINFYLHKERHKATFNAGLDISLLKHTRWLIAPCNENQILLAIESAARYNLKDLLHLIINDSIKNNNPSKQKILQFLCRSGNIEAVKELLSSDQTIKIDKICLTMSVRSFEFLKWLNETYQEKFKLWDNLCYLEAIIAYSDAISTLRESSTDLQRKRELELYFINIFNYLLKNKCGTVEFINGSTIDDNIVKTIKIILKQILETKKEEKKRIINEEIARQKRALGSYKCKVATKKSLKRL